MYLIKILLAHSSETQLRLIGEVIKNQSLKIEIVGSVSNLDALYDAIIRHMPDLVILPEGFFSPCINTITDLSDVICITENRSYKEAGNIRYAFVPVQPPELLSIIQKIYKEQDEAMLANRLERRKDFYRKLQLPQHYCSTIDTFCFEHGLTKNQGFSPFTQRREILSMILNGQLPLEKIKEQHPGTGFDSEQIYNTSIKQIIDNVEEQEQQKVLIEQQRQPGQKHLEFFRLPKTDYIVGEQIQRKTLLIKLMEENKSFELIQDFEFSPDRPLTKEDKEITVTARNLQLSWPITVADKAIIGAVISSMPKKTTYIKGVKDLNLDGGMLSIFYTNNTNECIPITNDMIESFNGDSVGQQIIYVLYKDQRLPFQIQIEDRTLKKVFIKTPPQKYEYIEGEYIDVAGMELMAEYDDGTQELITNFECPDIQVKQGQAVVKLTYQSQIFPLFIRVSEFKIIGIRMVQLPKKLTYLEYRDVLDITGGTVAKILNNGEEEIIPLEQRMVSGFNNQKVGKCAINVMIEQFQCSFDIDIIPKEAVSLEIVHIPHKMTYFESESFDSSGMELKVKYNNNTVKIANEYRIEPEVLLLTTECVTISCEGLTVKLPITMNSRIVEEISIARMPDVLSFKEGVDAINVSGGLILVLYNNGDVETIEMKNEMIEGFDNMIPGESTVSIRYQNAETKYNIIIIPKILIGLMISTPPKKTTYHVNELLDLDGLTVMGFFDTGKMEEIKNYFCSPMEPLSKDTTAIVVSYLDKSAIIPINVIDEPLQKPMSDLTLEIESMSVPAPKAAEVISYSPVQKEASLPQFDITETNPNIECISESKQKENESSEDKSEKFYSKSIDLRFRGDEENMFIFF